MLYITRDYNIFPFQFVIQKSHAHEYDFDWQSLVKTGPPPLQAASKLMRIHEFCRLRWRQRISLGPSHSALSSGVPENVRENALCSSETLKIMSWWWFCVSAAGAQPQHLHVPGEHATTDSTCSLVKIILKYKVSPALCVQLKQSVMNLTLTFLLIQIFVVWATKKHQAVYYFSSNIFMASWSFG